MTVMEAAAASIGWRRRLRDRAAGVGRRLVATLRVWAPSSSRPLPRIEVEVGMAVPAWAVLASVASVGLACVILVVRPGLLMGLLVGLLALTLVRAQSPAGGVFALLVGVTYVGAGAAPFAWTLHALLAGLPFVVLLSAWAAGVPLGAKVEVAALRSPLRRYLGGQVIAHPTALVGGLVSGAGVTLVWLPVASALGLIATAWWLMLRVEGVRPADRRVTTGAAPPRGPRSAS